MKNSYIYIKKILFYYCKLFKDNLFIVSVFSSILFFFAIYLPLSYDEVLSWKYFIRKNILYAIFTYPDTNNHIFHSFIQNIFWHITFYVNQPFTLRIIPIIASVTALAILINQLKFQIHKYILFILILSQFEFLEFAFQARGYSIGLLCSVLSTLALHKNFPIKYFIILSAIGLYNNPSYLYTYLMLNIVLAQRGYGFKKFITIGLKIGLITFSLYLPVLLNDGLNSITQNRYVSGINNYSLITLLDHFKLLIDRFGGVIFSTTMFLLISIKLKALRMKDIIYAFAMLMSLILLMVILKQTPFPRIFIPVFGVFLYGFTILLNRNSYNPIEAKLKNIPKSRFIPIIIISGISICFYWNKNIEKEDLSNSYLLKDFIQSKNYNSDVNKIFISNHSLTSMILPLEGHFYFKNKEVIYTDKNLLEIKNNYSNFYYITSDLKYKKENPIYEFNNFNRTTLILHE